MKRDIPRLRVADANTEVALEAVRAALREILREPLLNSNTIEVELPDGEEVRVLHGLGRRFKNVWVSPPQGAQANGRIEEIRSTKPDSEVRLKATGYGADVAVRVTVF